MWPTSTNGCTRTAWTRRICRARRWRWFLPKTPPAPAHRGEEIAPDVLEAHVDEIFDEAENRIYVEKAVLAVLLAGK